MNPCLPGCDAIDKLKSKLINLDKEILDPNKFKEFYQFTFNYAKNPSQKGLDLEMALAYWNIVMAGRYILLVKQKFGKKCCPFQVQVFEFMEYFLERASQSLNPQGHLEPSP